MPAAYGSENSNYNSFTKLERAKGFEPHACNARIENKRGFISAMFEIGAGEGIRTLDPDLGKVVLYP
jgi:hypothetical protein